MIKCPSCGAEQRFDIATQKMKCAYCGTVSKVPPDEEGQTADATYETNVFTCPNCGGEIESSSEEAAGFCPYRGETTTFGKRLSSARRPEKIIPFQKTKEDCKKAYLEKLKHAIYAPDDMKNEKYIDSFRGIYMPYWQYNIDVAGTVTGNSQKIENQGSFDLITNYKNSCDVKAHYSGFLYDSSTAYSDSVSRAVEPYHHEKAVPFRMGYIMGFYTDAEDVPADYYLPDAEQAAEGKVRDDAAKKFFPGNCSGLKFTKTDEETDPERVLMPVWFMSYKNGNRVAYSAVNGQTGEIAVDIPVDPKKFMIGTAVITLILFIILSLFTITPLATMTISSLALAAAAATYTNALRHTNANIINDAAPAKEKDELKAEKSEKNPGIIGSLIAAVFFGFIFFNQITSGSKSQEPAYAVMLGIVVFIFILVKALRKKPEEAKGSWTEYLLMLAADAVIMAVAYYHPVNDLWYYLPSTFAIISAVVAAVSTIRRFNTLSTHKMPQFARKGGDDRA